MKISIITVTYNSQDTIESTLQSVLNQTYKDIEYIIIDGKSKDDTLKIISKYETRIHKIISEKDNGIYDALNKGISLASGDVIGILHSDDLYANSRVIEDVVQKFQRESPDAVYGDLNYVNRLDTTQITRRWKAGEYSPGAFFNGWMPPHPSFFVKRSMYERYGKFNLSLKSAADYELMLRFIHRHEIKITYLPKVLVKMRVGGQSNVTIKNRLKANLEDRKAWQLNGIEPKWYTLYLKPLRKIFQFKV